MAVARVMVMGVLRGYIEHGKTLSAQIEQGVMEADQGKFASDEQAVS